MQRGRRRRIRGSSESEELREIRRTRKEAHKKTLQILGSRIPKHVLRRRSEKQFADEVHSLAAEDSIFSPTLSHDSIIPVLDDLYILDTLTARRLGHRDERPLSWPLMLMILHDERDRGRAAAAVVEEMLVELQEPISQFSKLTSSILYAKHIALKPLAAFQSTFERFLARLLVASKREDFDHLAFTREIRTDLAFDMGLAITTAEHDLGSLF